MFPLTRVPFWVPSFDPRPFLATWSPLFVPKGRGVSVSEQDIWAAPPSAKKLAMQ